MKLRSGMTLFAQIPGTDPVFGRIPDKFFNGKPDGKTLPILGLSAQ